MLNRRVKCAHFRRFTLAALLRIDFGNRETSLAAKLLIHSGLLAFQGKTN